MCLCEAGRSLRLTPSRPDFFAPSPRSVGFPFWPSDHVGQPIMGFVRAMGRTASSARQAGPPFGPRSSFGECWQPLEGEVRSFGLPGAIGPLEPPDQLRQEDHLPGGPLLPPRPKSGCQSEGQIGHQPGLCGLGCQSYCVGRTWYLLPGPRQAGHHQPRPWVWVGCWPG